MSELSKELLSPQVIWKLETNVDDCTGEAIALCAEKLFEAGAREVFYTPVYMKKSRPGTLISVICEEDKITDMERLLFIYTSTIGIRRVAMERTVAERRFITVSTPYGECEVKVSTMHGVTKAAPEFESVKVLCEKTGAPFQSVYAAAQSAASMAF